MTIIGATIPVRCHPLATEVASATVNALDTRSPLPVGVSFSAETLLRKAHQLRAEI